MRTSDFDYELPDELIAQEPLAVRDEARMLVVRKETGEREHRVFRELPDYLKPGDLLVMNDTRVTARRIFGVKEEGAQVEALVLKPLGDNLFEALVKPGKRLRTGAKVTFEGDLRAEVVEETEFGGRVLRFENHDAEARINQVGLTPLPPYIHKSLPNPERYQTVYNRTGGSAAAPTAGLHFTPELLDRIKAMGVAIGYVTLDVGLDTFRPVKSDVLEEHEMHGEPIKVTPELAEQVERCQGRIIAVGTTSVRTLESMAVGKRRVEPGRKETRLFITPGYEFQVVDSMLTNFHMPRTTMLAMISALAGRDAIMDAYRDAVQRRYRFLSFGDSMFIL